MTRAESALLAMVVAALALLGGYWWGRTDGASVAKAKQAEQLVADMGTLLDKHAGLVTASNAASQTLRRAAAARGQVDLRTTKELKDALAKTADSRAGCRFDAAVMQHLEGARERAAAAAAGSRDGAVPAATGAARQ
jgi:hypothetical protein